MDGLIDITPDGRPVPEQVYQAIGQAVRSGRLRPGDRLPSSRRLAESLGISRNSVNGAYELLRADGVVSVRQGAVPVVVTGAQRETASAPGSPDVPMFSERGQAVCGNVRSEAYARTDGLMQPGTPDEDAFPSDLWARTLRRVARRRYGDSAIYSNTSGLPRLKHVLADYLTRTRGLSVTEEQILITPSTQAGLTLAATCLAAPGDTAWTESPGYFGARAAFEAAGLDIVPLPVDAEGANPDLADASTPPKLIYVTPSHQYPTGARMTLARRLALLDRARQTGAVILEDDYDSEFLWQGRAIAALQGIGEGNQVVYLGTTAKSLLPGLRLAFMAVPEPLAPGFAMAMRNMGMLANLHAQAALADFIESGHYARQLRRISKIYESRGAVLVERLRARLGGAIKVDMPMGGVQLMVSFTGDPDDRAISARLAEAGFNTPALSAYCLDAPRSGLVIGFSDADDKLATRFADCLAGAL